MEEEKPDDFKVSVDPGCAFWIWSCICIVVGAFLQIIISKCIALWIN